MAHVWREFSPPAWESLGWDAGHHVWQQQPLVIIAAALPPVLSNVSLYERTVMIHSHDRFLLLLVMNTGAVNISLRPKASSSLQ